MYEYNFDIMRSLTSPMTGMSYGANLPAPLGATVRVSAKSLGLVLGGALACDWIITLMFVRFSAAVTSAGRVCHWTSDATYGYGCVTSTWASTLTYSNAGISAHAVTAAGDYGFIQVAGMNGWVMTATAAALAIGDVLYPTATNVVTLADTDAKRVQRIGTNMLVDADGGATTIGQVMITPNSYAF